MPRVPRLGAILLLLLIVGCSLIPSGWRIGGSPLDNVEKKEAVKTEARENLLQAAQGALHQATIAFEAVDLTSETPANQRSILLGTQFTLQAQDLLDQAIGIPPEAKIAGWRNLSSRLLCENAEIRTAAQKERTADGREISRISERFAQATAAAQRANSRALDYARESEGYADFARKLKLSFFGLIGLIVLGTILSLAARFVPALGLASKVVNGIVAPGITFVAHRAEDGLKRIGQGMASLRAAGNNAEELIAKHFNGVTDADQQAIIAAAAKAAGAGPPTSSP